MLSNAWSWYVIILTVANILAMLWLLLATSKKETGEEGDTTGHEWDGIQELNNPLPRWWFGLFIITIVFSGAYLYLYPGLGNYQGSLQWSQTGQYETAKLQNTERQNAYFADYVDMPVAELAENGVAMETGKRLFLNNCATCHGSNAQGAKGFPNLTDAAWLYGNAPDTLVQTITNGRAGIMPNLQLPDKNVSVLARYVRHLGGVEEATDFVLEEAGNMFVICATCHGPEGKGNQALGAPNLTDDAWLHGSSIAEVEAILRNGKQGNMPSFEQQLSATEIKLLAAYVLSLADAESAE